MSHNLQANLSDDDWDDWARSPATRAFVAQLEEAIRDAGIAWTEKRYVGETDADTLRYNHAALGEVSGLRKVLQAIAEKEKD